MHRSVRPLRFGLSELHCSLRYRQLPKLQGRLDYMRAVPLKLRSVDLDECLRVLSHQKLQRDPRLATALISVLPVSARLQADY